MPVSGMNQELLTKAEHLGMFITQSSPQWVACTLEYYGVKPLQLSQD